MLFIFLWITQIFCSLNQFHLKYWCISLYIDYYMFIQSYSCPSKFLRKMRPSWCHFRHRLVSKSKVMRFLVVFDSTCLEHWSSISWIIPELISSWALEVGSVDSKSVVGSYLIKCILISEEFVLRIRFWIFLLSECLSLLRLEILTPTTRVIPVARL